MNFADLQTPLTDEIEQEGKALSAHSAYQLTLKHARSLEKRITVQVHNTDMLTRDAERWRGIATQMQKERDQWRANHDNQVKIKNTIVQRPDLGDRANRVAELIERYDNLRNTVGQLHDMAKRWREECCNNWIRAGVVHDLADELEGVLPPEAE